MKLHSLFDQTLLIQSYLILFCHVILTAETVRTLRNSGARQLQLTMVTSLWNLFVSQRRIIKSICRPSLSISVRKRIFRYPNQLTTTWWYTRGGSYYLGTTDLLFLLMEIRTSLLAHCGLYKLRHRAVLYYHSIQDCLLFSISISVA